MTKPNHESQAQGATSADDEHIIVGCDDGYAAIKLAFMDAGHLMETTIPSRAAIGRNLMGTTDGSSSDCSYTADGVDYTVSEHVDAQDTRFQAYPVSALNRVLIHHALRAAGLGGRSVRLVTGLPPGRYYSNGVKHERLISAKQQNLLQSVEPLDGRPPANIIDHQVHSEAAAGLVDYLVNNNGEQLREVDAPLAVVDIGGRTSDCLTVLPPGNQVDHARTGSIDVGVMAVRDHLRRGILEQFDLDSISDRALDTALRTNALRLYGREHDLSDVLTHAKRQVTEQILRYVESRVTNMAEVEQVIFIGGGAAVLADLIKDFPQGYVSNRPEFANARGMFKYAQLMRA